MRYSKTYILTTSFDSCNMFAFSSLIPSIVANMFMVLNWNYFVFLGADITDYFNYGFNEESWKQYCSKQNKLRAENGLSAPKFVSNVC